MRLLRHLSQNRVLHAYIGMPLRTSNRWVKVKAVSSNRLLCEDSQIIDPQSVRSFIVAYNNGELLDWEHPFRPWPDGVHSIEPAAVPRTDTITLGQLDSSEQYARVVHGPSKSPKVDAHYNSTTLHNLSRERIRVNKFAGYNQVKSDMYRLSTITGDYFTAEEFQAWYGLGENEWIEPGQSACDPENYGGTGALWAYFCVTESGHEIIVGSIYGR